jgi:hypothetical protein
MTTTNPTHQQAYESRVKAFAGNKTFQYLTSVKVKRGDIKCDACGSKLVQELRLIMDSKGNYYLIGVNCHTVLFNEHKMIWGISYPFEYTKMKQIAERIIAERIKQQ